MWRFTRRTDEDFASEIDAHLTIETDRLIAEGLSPDEARDVARRSFGNVVGAQERFHEAHRWVWLEQLAQDLRYAWRGLCHAKAFAATTVVTLAIAIGLVTVIFAVFNVYVLRPFAVHDPHSLYEIAWLAPDARGRTFNVRELEELTRRTDLFDAVVADSTRLVSSAGGRVVVSFVSGNYFETLGPRIGLGRGLASFDALAPGAAPVVVVSDDAWTRLFDRDPGVIGRHLDLNGLPFVVVGVLRPEFSGLDESPRDAWVPLTMFGAVTGQDLFGPEQPRQVTVTARLRRGVTAEQTEAALTPFVRRVTNRRDNVRPGVEARATPNPITFKLLALLSPVFAAFGLVLVTACANVSNVMLARANTRHREMAVRLSMGASRGRVVRQLMTEGLLLAVLAGVGGLLVASLALRGGVAMFLSALPPSVAALTRVVPLPFDHRVFAFAMGVAVFSSVAFALVPALQATGLTLTDALRGQPTGKLRAALLRDALVVGQVTVSLVLMVAAATLVRNGAALDRADPVIVTQGVTVLSPQVDDPTLLAKAVGTLTADPRVDAVAVASRRPLSELLRKIPVAPVPGSAVPTPYTFISSAYFSILSIPIVRGRGFLAEEAREQARVAIVSAATSRAFWPGQDPIGRTVRIEASGPELDTLPGYSEVTVVGVAKDVVSGMIFDGVDAGHIYLPTSATGQRPVAVLVRGHADRDLTPGAVATAVRGVHSDPLAFDTMPLDEMLALQMFPLRMASWIGCVLGVVALALSVSGLYGVLTYTLSQRTKEIGIRMALGATAGAVVRLVMRQSARLTGLGVALGLTLAFAAMKTLSTFVELRNVSIVDGVAFGTALGLVLTSAAIAAYFPASRATRVNPAQTLRSDP